MSLWKRIRTAIQRHRPTPEAIFKLANSLHQDITLSFTDRRRLLHTADCHIKTVRKKQLQLKLGQPLPTRVLGREKCFLYFKLKADVLQKYLGITHDLSQNGFLCRSIILAYDQDDKGLVHELGVSMPTRYLRRELRHSERHRIFSGHLAEAALWVRPPDANVFDMAQKPDYASDSSDSGEQAMLRIVNISAGGAKIAIEHVEYQEKFATLESSRLFLFLRLHIPPLGDRPVLLAAHCISYSYNIRLSRLIIHLQFAAPPLLPSLKVYDSQNKNPDIQNSLLKGPQLLQLWLDTHFPPYS